MITPLTAERAHELVRKMSGCRVVVLGDLMLDRFLWGRVTRISPEAPVPVVHLSSETAVLGGAGNVARNLLALGGRVNLVGVLGRDAGGNQVRELLKGACIEDDGVFTVEGCTTTVKTRVIAHHQQVVRIDREILVPLSSDTREAICQRIAKELSGAKALLISDYDKGVVSPELLERILPMAFSSGAIVAIDPKPANFEHYRPATVLTPNAQEARMMAGLYKKGNGDLHEAASRIREHLGCPAVLVTQGEDGMILFPPTGSPLVIPAFAREVFDVTGAGDTVISTLTLALVAQASFEEAAILANAAAGCVVGKLGTAVVGPDELECAVRERSA